MRFPAILPLLLIFLLAPGLVTAQNKFSKAADEAFSDQMYLLALQKYQKAYSKVK